MPSPHTSALSFTVVTRSLKLPKSYFLTASPSERLLASVGRDVSITDLVQRKRLWASHPLSHPSCAAFSPSEALLAVKSTWGEIALLCVESGEKLFAMRPKRQDEGPDLIFSADGSLLVDGSWSGDLRIRQVSDLSIVETFGFKGEMIKAVSCDANRSRWLIAHQPKWTATTPIRRPYLSIWTWPLRMPDREVDPGFDVLDAAVLSPSSNYIAAVGYSSATRARELRLLTLAGKIVAATPVSSGGTGANTRWSPDSKLVGTVGNGEFMIFSMPDLHLYARIQEQYPADMTFIRDGAEIVLGSWSQTRVQTVPVE
jgi:WD40 repeat protein